MKKSKKKPKSDTTNGYFLMQVISQIWKPSTATLADLMRRGYFIENIEFIVEAFINDIRETNAIPIDTNQYFRAYAKRRLPKPSENCLLSDWQLGKQFTYFAFNFGLTERFINEHRSLYKDWIISQELEKTTINHDQQFKEFLSKLNITQA